LITISRSGKVDGTTTARVFAENGTATQRGDFTFAARIIRFAPGETTKQIPLLITDDAYAEGTETATLRLADVRGGSLGPLSAATLEINDNDVADGSVNPIDDPLNFVGEHYHDFLNRQSDTDGQAFWTREITACGSDQQCIEAKRVMVSAAFYISIEFQQTGYLVERIYKASYGDAQAASNWNGSHQLAVPVIRLDEFLTDTQQIGEGVTVGRPGWEQALENNTRAFTEDFVQRSRFMSAFPSTMTPAEFVDQLNRNAGNPLSSAERDQLVNDLSSGAKTRAQILRAVAEDPDLAQAEIQKNIAVLAPYSSKPLRHFCYPSGIWSEKQWPILADAGIRSATTCEPGLNSSLTRPFAMARFLDGEDVRPVEFEAEMQGYSELLRRTRGSLRRISTSL